MIIYKNQLDNSIHRIKKALKSKKNFINFYRGYCSLDLEGNVYSAIDKKIEYARKKSLGLSYGKHKIFLTNQFNKLLNDKNLNEKLK